MRTPTAQRPTSKGLLFLAAFAICASFAVSSGAAAPSPVADAAQRGDKGAVRALIARKSDVNAPQNDGATAVHWAAFRGDLELAEILLRAGAKCEGGQPRGRDAALARGGQRRRADDLRPAQGWR